MEQANQHSNTVDSAAQSLVDSGVMDSILGEDNTEAEQETQHPEVVDEVESEAEDIEQPDSETEEADEAEEAEEAETEEETDDTDEPEEEQEQVALETVDQLAEALEVDKDQLLDNLQIKVVIDGQEQSVSLKEAQAGYQKDADYRRKTGELAEQRRAFEAKSQEQTEQVEYQHTVAANMLQLAENQLLGELQSANMEELRQTDPVAWTAKRADLYERQQQLQQAKQQAANAYMQNRQQLEQQQLEQNQTRLAQEAEALSKALPEFKDIKPKLDSYLTDKLGFSNDDLTGVSDHRLILLAHKAMLYDQGQQKAKAVKKVVKKAPKMQKPSKPAPQLSAAKSALSKAKKNLKASGHVNDAAKLIENML